MHLLGTALSHVYIVPCNRYQAYCMEMYSSNTYSLSCNLLYICPYNASGIEILRGMGWVQTHHMSSLRALNIHIN